ncbi:MAG: RNA-binding S4 domain-containing protein [Rhodobacteraceae bacterium]|nr:RNA-binding S4 domain-containing protein [Paracoccaceae bacterium]
MSDAPEKLRVDKWLWHARFFKTRSLAAKIVNDGRVGVNGTRISKPSQPVSAGDVLAFAQARVIRVVRIDALCTRRGSAEEAQTLYTDLEPKEDKSPENPAYAGIR